MATCLPGSLEKLCDRRKHWTHHNLRGKKRNTANQKSALVKLTGLKWSILPSLMRMLMKRWKMKPLPANPGLEASLMQRQRSRSPPQKTNEKPEDIENRSRSPLQARKNPKIANPPLRSNLNLSIRLLSIFCKPPVLDGPEAKKVDKETVDTEFCLCLNIWINIKPWKFDSWQSFWVGQILCKVSLEDICGCGSGQMICTRVGRAQLVLGESACGDSFQCLYRKFLLAPAQLVLFLRTLNLPILFVRNFRLGWPTTHVIFPVLGCRNLWNTSWVTIVGLTFVSLGLVIYDFAVGLVPGQVFQACLRSSLCGWRHGGGRVLRGPRGPCSPWEICLQVGLAGWLRGWFFAGLSWWCKRVCKEFAMLLGFFSWAEKKNVQLISVLKCCWAKMMVWQRRWISVKTTIIKF